MEERVIYSSRDQPASVFGWLGHELRLSCLLLERMLQCCVTTRLKGLHSKSEGLRQTLEFLTSKDLFPSSINRTTLKNIFYTSFMYAQISQLKGKMHQVALGTFTYSLCHTIASASRKPDDWDMKRRLNMMRCVNQFLNAFFLSMHL